MRIYKLDIKLNNCTQNKMAKPERNPPFLIAAHI